MRWNKKRKLNLCHISGCMKKIMVRNGVLCEEHRSHKAKIDVKKGIIESTGQES